jgi:hypothetical protein
MCAVRACFSKLIEAEAKEAKAINKQLNGYYVIDLSHDWLVSETVKFEKKGNKWEATLKKQPYSFSFDKMGYGIQDIKGDCKFTRISMDQDWKLKYLGTHTITHYYAMGSKIVAFNLCDNLEAEVYYAPDLTSEDDIVPSGKHMDIMNLVVASMKQAANGYVIDTSANQNTNKSILTELDNAIKMPQIVSK